MSDKSLGDKLEHQVENLKDGLKGIAQRLTPPPSPSASKEELYADAKRLGIKGRSKMTKEELARAIHRH